MRPQVPETAEAGFPPLVEAVMEAAPDALVVVDACGRITLMNAQTERLFGYLRDELHGQSIETLIPQRFLIWPCAASHGLSRCPNNASEPATLPRYARTRRASAPSTSALDARASSRSRKLSMTASRFWRIVS